MKVIINNQTHYIKFFDKMKIHLALFLLLFIVLSHASAEESNYPDSVNFKIEYPHFDITAGLGFIWLVQVNMTISPIPYLYVQPRFSTIIIAYEYGMTSGIQFIFNNDSLIRFGIGYSKGAAIAFGSSENNTWESLYFRLGLLIRRGKTYIYNPNINIIVKDKRPIFSFNFTLGFCLFR